MKPLAGAFALLLVVADPAFSQQTAAPAAAPSQLPPTPADASPPVHRVRVFVTESDSWQSAGGSGGGRGIFGGGFSGGASPQTAEVIKTIRQRCPDLTVNSRVDASDYVIRLEHEGGKGLLRKKDKVAVFQQKSGDSIFSASTLSVGGSVQEACDAIAKDWPSYSAQVTSMPNAQPVPAETMAVTPSAAAPASLASLTVESSVPGADIEIDGSFVGNTPSTLSVTPGPHTVVVKKKGYADWSRQMTVAGNAVHLNADLTTATATK